MDTDTSNAFLPLLILGIYFGLVVAVIRHMRSHQVDNQMLWVLVLLLFGAFGILLYLIVNGTKPPRTPQA